jgi:phage head maturation protease
MTFVPILTTMKIYCWDVCRAGTLRISTDKRGLFYEVDLPNTTYANDLAELMKRGDVNQSFIRIS